MAPATETSARAAGCASAAAQTRSSDSRTPPPATLATANNVMKPQLVCRACASSSYSIPAIHSPARDVKGALPDAPTPASLCFERAAQDASRVVDQLLSSAKLSLAVRDTSTEGH